MASVYLDDQLIADTMRLTGLSEKGKAVEAALRQQLDMEKQKRTLGELWGSFDWQGDLEESRLDRDFLLTDDHC